MTKMAVWIIDKPENCSECPIPLHATVNRTEYLMSGCFQYSKCPLVPFDIQPTVEAIPKEWIKHFAEKIWWEDERAVIEDMLEHWEKENE